MLQIGDVPFGETVVAPHATGKGKSVQAQVLRIEALGAQPITFITTVPGEIRSGRRHLLGNDFPPEVQLLANELNNFVEHNTVVLPRALSRGWKQDESIPGHGLGLAIVNDLVELYGGKLKLGKSRFGGLRAELELPAK